MDDETPDVPMSHRSAVLRRMDRPMSGLANQGRREASRRLIGTCGVPAAGQARDHATDGRTG